MGKKVRLAVCLCCLMFTALAAEGRKDGKRLAVLAEQARHYIAIVDTDTGDLVWTWDVTRSGLPEEHRSWFNCPTEVKPVYGGDIILVVSNGGIALVRISDHKVVWYAASGGGFPHSAELLPDGNVAVACSSSGTPAGDKLKIYTVDYNNFPELEPAASYPLKSGHNVVWDRKNRLLWATAYTTLNSYVYSTEGGRPSFILKDCIPLPEGAEDPHDMFPVHGQRKLWLTTSDNLFIFDPVRRSFEKTDVVDGLEFLKSVSSGPEGWPVMVLRPTVSWWSDTLRDIEGNVIYDGPDYFKVYKARWMLDNTFSYPRRHKLSL